MGSDDMFKVYNYNPNDPCNPALPSRVSADRSDLKVGAHGGQLKGWKRIVVLALLLGWFILVGTWTPS